MIEAQTISKALDNLHLNGGTEAFDRLMVKIASAEFNGTHGELMQLWRRIRADAKGLNRTLDPRFRAAVTHLIKENRRIARGRRVAQPKAASVNGAVSAQICTPFKKRCAND